MKKILAILLMLAMMFSLAACGGGGDDGKTPASNNPQSSQQQEQPEDKPPEADPVADEPEDTPAPEVNSDDRFTEFGLSFAEVEPEGNTGFEISADEDSNYAVTFAMPGVVSEDVGTAYYKQIYDLTAAAADDGANHKKIGGSAWNPDLEALGAWEDAGIYDDHLVEWYYKYNGKLCLIQVMGGIGLNEQIGISIIS